MGNYMWHQLQHRDIWGPKGKGMYDCMISISTDFSQLGRDYRVTY